MTSSPAREVSPRRTLSLAWLIAALVCLHLPRAGATESTIDGTPAVADSPSAAPEPSPGPAPQAESITEQQPDPLRRAHRLSYLASPDHAIAEYERILAGSLTPRVAQEARMGIAALEFAKGDYRRARETLRDVLLQVTDWDLVKYGTYQLKEIDRRIAWGSSFETRMSECGVHSLREVLRSRGLQVSVLDVATRVESMAGTSSLSDLRRAAAAFGLEAVGARPEERQLRELPKPFIAHLHPNHFVVVTKSKTGGLRVLDPEIAGGVLPLERFLERWSGSVLVFPQDGAGLGTVARLTELEMTETRGGHHLHGNHLGDASSNPASAFHGGPSSMNPCAGAGLPDVQVNLANFNLLVQDTDFAYRGLGPPVYLQRTYNADDPDESVFGRSWSFNYGMAVEEQPGGSVSLRRESGKEEFFALLGCTAGTCTYDPPIWIHDELFKHADGTFELRVKQTRLVQRFDSAGRLVSVVDRNGNTVILGYGTAGRLTTVTDAAGRVSSFAYGTDGRVSGVVDPTGKQATFTYDGAGHLVATTDMAGNEVTYTYDSNSYMASVTTPTGTWAITNVPYDEPAFGLVVESITDPLGHTTTYSTPGLVVVDVEDANGIVWKYFPTGEGQIGSMTDPLGNSTRFQYNASGDLARVTDALGGVTQFAWDVRGNLTRITDPLGNRLDLAYDPGDNLIRLLDPLGNSYDYVYDGRGNLTQITDAAGGITIYAYDALGQPTSFSDARGKTTILSYDAQGNLESMTTPLGKQTLYEHDSVGRPTRVITPRGVTRTFQWDGIDRLTKVTYPDASEVTYTYGCCQLQSVSGPSGTLSFNYDAANRPSSYTDVWGNTIRYGFDPGGRLTGLTYPDGKVVTYAYDAAGRLTRVTDWLGGVTTYQFDPLSQNTRSDLANGSVTLYNYDAGSRLTDLTNLAPDGALISRYQYSYDALGNRIHAEQYEPVALSILDETVAYHYDDDNQLTSADAALYGYDGDGNLISRSDEGGVTEYGYDFDGRLVRVQQGEQATQYVYDDFGTRVGEIESGVAARFAVDPLGPLSQLLFENRGSAGLSHHVYGLGLLSTVDSGGYRYSYHYDAVGSTVALTDAGGGEVARYGYRPYGRTAADSWSTIPNLFQYLGRFGVLRENELMDMRARYYDETSGRFGTKEPMGIAAGSNLYWYGRGNPFTWADPDGQLPLVFWMAVAGVLEVLLVAAAADTAVSVVMIQMETSIAILRDPCRSGSILREAGARLSAQSVGVGPNLLGPLQSRFLERWFKRHSQKRAPTPW